MRWPKRRPPTPAGRVARPSVRWTAFPTPPRTATWSRASPRLPAARRSGPGGPARCLHRRAPARRRGDLPGQDQHAAHGQRRHAARRLRPRGEPVQCRLPHRALRLGSSNGAGTATAASFAAFGLAEETWSSGAARRRTTACAPTPLRAGDLGARQLAADADHGRGGALCAEHGRPAGNPRRSGRRRSRYPRRPLAHAALGADPQGLRGTPGELPGPAAGAEALAGKRFGVPRMFINADPDAGTSESPGSAARPASASIPGPRSSPSGNRRVRPWKPPAPK